MSISSYHEQLAASPPGTAQPEPPPKPWASRLILVVAVLACGAAFLWVQFSFDGMYDGDSYFHTRAARELSRNGIERAFPQATFSTWAERYSDKDFLYHLLLIPFQAGHRLLSGGSSGEQDLVVPGKAAAAFFDLGLVAAFVLSLRLVGARFPLLWLGLLLSTHLNVLGHLLAVRPHVLGLALVTLEVALLTRRSAWPLAVVGYLHVLAHSSFVLLPLLAAASAAASILRRESVPWARVAAALGGVIAGNLLHPYFPNNLALAWDQLAEVARNVWSIAPVIPADLFGSELRAATTSDVLASFPAWVPALAGLAGWLGLSRPRPLSTEALALLFMGFVLGVLSFLSATFLVFFFAAATLLAARVWTELAAGRAFRQLWATSRREVAIAAAVLLSCLAAGQYRASFVSLQRKAQALPTRSAERPAIEFLRQNAPPGELVYHNFWKDFSALYHYRPEGRYVVALDPVFLYRHDRQRFDEMLGGYRGLTTNLYQTIAGRFGARWVYVSRVSRSAAFDDLLRRDARFQRVYSDAFAEVYRVAALDPTLQF